MLLGYIALALLATIPASVLAVPCTAERKLLRKEWRQLTSAEQQEYINAELCLQSLPAKTGLPGVVTRFDDLQAIHQVQAEIVHNVGQFLPFHRLLMHVHQELLRTECGYTGAQPWWNETLDAGNFANSPLLQANSFGGNGVGSSRCVTTGPFANYTLHLGPGHSVTNHCLTRNINERESLAAGSSYVAACLALPNFDQAHDCMERAPGPHSGGHGGVGGEHSNPISSPGDPIFYLHHSFLDRVWWSWQALDLPARLTDIAGYTTPTRPATGWVNTTLDYEMNLFGIRDNATVGDIMDIGGDLLCFEYS